MIAVMRKLIHNNVYKIFLWVFLIMMGMGSGLVFFRDENDKNWVIKAYSQTMSDKKFATMLQQAKQQHEMFRQRGFVLPNANVQKETIEAAIGSLLGQNAIEKLGVYVPQSHVDREVQKQLQNLPSYFFKEDGALNEEAFRKAIAPYTIEDFVADIESDAKNKLLYGLVDASLYVPQFELELQYNVDFADKKYSYFTLALQKYAAQVRQETPSDETLQKFYKKSQIVEKFKTAERRSGKLWTFDANHYIASISDAEAKSVYEKNKMTRYVVTPAQMQVRLLVIPIEPGKEQEAKSKIQELKQEADKDPSSFEAMVRKFSDDKASAAKGGLSELFTKTDTKMSKTIVDTTFEFLGTDGQISAPVKTDRGYELIQRVKKVPAKYKEFATVSSEIKHELGAEKFKKRFAQDAGRVVHGARYNPEALKAFINRYNGVPSEIRLETRKAGIDYTNLFRLEEGRYTQYFDKDKGVILLCEFIEKSITPPFAEVRSKVLGMYYESKALDLMQDQLAQAYKDAQTMPFEDVAAKYGASLHSAQFKYNDGKSEQSAILKQSEVAAKLKGLQYQGAIAAIETASDGILMRLDSIEKADSSSFQDQKGQTSKMMFYTKLYQSKEGFVASLYRIAKLNNKIEIKSEILQTDSKKNPNTKEV